MQEVTKKNEDENEINWFWENNKNILFIWFSFIKCLKYLI